VGSVRGRLGVTTVRNLRYFGEIAGAERKPRSPPSAGSWCGERRAGTQRNLHSGAESRRFGAIACDS